MLFADVVLAGGGVSGLLLAGALSKKCSVILIEQKETIPQNKYWLTDKMSVILNPDIEHCVDMLYNEIDFIAYDGFTARITGDYSLWDTRKLIDTLVQNLSDNSVRILTGHRLYSISKEHNGIIIRANSKKISAKILVDCMGFKSPLVGAKNIAKITGYYIVYGTEVNMKKEIVPVGLDNVIINQKPTYFELFPASNGIAQAAIILPTQQYKPGRSLGEELRFIINKSHYSEYIDWKHTSANKYFGIIPVGRLTRPALNRIIFFGESGQANPAASATGLSRILRTYRGLANSIIESINNDSYSEKA